MRRNRRRAFVPSLDRLPSRIAPATYTPASDFYPEFDDFGGGSSWEASGMDAICEPMGFDDATWLDD